MTSATDVPDSARRKANAICSSVKFFYPIEKPTLSSDVKGQNPNILDGSRNGENVSGADGRIFPSLYRAVPRAKDASVSRSPPARV
jgi:hypothetical protein